MQSHLIDQENMCRTHAPTKTTAYGKEIEAGNPEEWWILDIDQKEKIVDVIVTPEEVKEPKWKTVHLGMQKKLKEWGIGSLEATKEMHRRFDKDPPILEKNRKRPSVQEVQEGLEKKLAKVSEEVPKQVNQDLPSTYVFYMEALNKAKADFPELFKNFC